MSRWFRWYEGTCEDGKFRMVARNAEVTVATVMGVWAVLLEDASHIEHRGVATRGEDFYAAILDMTAEDLQHVLQFMDDIGLISVGHGAITITKWKERQFETDTTDPTNAIRQQRWRDKHKPNDPVTDRNAAVTETKRPDTETEAYTETEKKDSRAVAKATRPVEPSPFDEFWKAYPRRDGANPKEPARKLFLAAVKAGAEASAIIDGARRCALADHEKIGTPYIPQAVKWLRDRRWADYAPDALPNVMTDAEREQMFRDMRGKNAIRDSEKGEDVHGPGAGTREGPRPRREEPTADANHQARNGRVGGMAKIFSHPFGLRAGDHEDDREGAGDGDDGAGAVARRI